MRYKHLLLASTIALTTAALAFQYQRVWRWRSLTREVTTLLQAARATDTADLSRMVTDSDVSQRLLTMARHETAQTDTLLASLTLIFASQRPDMPGFVVAHYRTRTTICGYPDALDEFQVTAVRHEAGWRFAYASITPC